MLHEMLNSFGENRVETFHAQQGYVSVVFLDHFIGLGGYSNSERLALVEALAVVSEVVGPTVTVLFLTPGADHCRPFVDVFRGYADDVRRCCRPDTPQQPFVRWVWSEGKSVVCRNFDGGVDTPFLKTFACFPSS